MFKFLWRRRAAAPCVSKDWRHDPMGHPSLAGMDLRMLADLPMVAELPSPVAGVRAVDPCRETVTTAG